LAEEDFKTSNSKEEQAQDILSVRGIVNVGQNVWQPPPIGVLKINWDVAVNKKNGCIGIGIIARDCNGFFLSASSFSQKLVVDPKGAEAIVALYVLILCKEVGFFDIIL